MSTDKLTRRQFVSAVGTAALAATLPARLALAADEEPISLMTFAFNTVVTVTAYGVSREQVSEVLMSCGEYEALFSARMEGSDIARINESAGRPVEVDPRTAQILAAALDFGQQSQGRFDITIGSVSLLWDFENAVRPSDEAIAEAVRHVDYTCVGLKGTTVTLADPKAKIDLGGIAKGWIASQMVNALVKAGATGGIVSLGTSSNVLFGSKPSGEPWRMGLRDPSGSLSSLMGVIDLRECAVTSSGLYDQRFEADGVTYWHILDPATGMPAITDMLGDTIICDDPMTGDALSTMCFIMGKSEASAWLAEKHPDVKAMFIGEDGEPVFANGFEKLNLTPYEG